MPNYKSLKLAVFRIIVSHKISSQPVNLSQFLIVHVSEWVYEILPDLLIGGTSLIFGKYSDIRSYEVKDCCIFLENRA